MKTVRDRPFYDRCLKALDEAHKACFKHPDRDILGMSHGPFSGVNEVLGIVDSLEVFIDRQAKYIELLELRISELSKDN